LAYQAHPIKISYTIYKRTIIIPVIPGQVITCPGKLKRTVLDYLPVGSRKGVMYLKGPQWV
jgi:hypothetical protein